MSFERGRYWLTYNGEIYNYLELRTELEGAGAVFRTRTDSEVLLAAYARWGKECLKRLNGMFAFAVWDDAEKTLFAARDRFGIKPLYVHMGSDGICLASEIKQIACLEGFSAQLNPARAADFLVTGVSDHTQDTFFCGVMQLRGSHCLSIDHHWQPGREPRITRWYRLDGCNGAAHSGSDDAVAKFAELLGDSVRIRLRSDVPVGSCLSGGLDSSSIVSLAKDFFESQQSAAVQATFSACYDDDIADERQYIDLVTAEKELKNEQVFPQAADLLDELGAIAYQQDEPFATSSIFAQWKVFERAARSGVKVMLDGQGADEQLAGYHSMYGPFQAGLLRRFRIVRLIRELRARNRRHGVAMKVALLELLMSESPLVYKLLTGWTERTELPRWINPEILANTRLTETLGAMGVDRDLETTCRRQLMVSSVPRLVRYEDRNSMAHSVEARLPFLDYRLVEFLASLGDNKKIVDGETKWILRQAMKGIVPAPILERQDKMGFATPEDRWLRGPLRELVHDSLRGAARRFPELVRRSELDELASRWMKADESVGYGLWRVVSLNAWGQAFHVSM
jgi:asparagine synthase (glutamine-hydrolysing)